MFGFKEWMLFIYLGLLLDIVMKKNILDLFYYLKILMCFFKNVDIKLVFWMNIIFIYVNGFIVGFIWKGKVVW